ncbi:hypothetical protein ACHAQE_008552 [Botrytis cinerea]
MSSEPPPPPPPPPHLHPQPHNIDYLKIIRSPTGIYRWLDGIGESGGQPVPPSNNVPNGPLSGNQYVMDNEVDLKSPSSGTHAPASRKEGDSAESSQESVQAEEALNKSHQHALDVAQQFPSIGAQRLPLNQQSYADYSFENPPVPNSTDNANQGIHDRNNQQPNPMGLPLQGFTPQGMPLNQQFFVNQPRNSFEYPATPYLTNNSNQGMQDGNNRTEYPSYPAALQYGKINTSPTPWELSKNDITGNYHPGNMMTMNSHPSTSRYHSTYPLGQIAHQTDMTTGTINTMNYPSGTSGQVLGNSLFYPVNGPNQFPFNDPNQFSPVTGSNLFNPVNGPNQFLPVTGSNQFHLVNDPSQFPFHGPSQFLPVDRSNQIVPLVPRQQNDVFHSSHGLPNPTPVSVGRAIDYPSESGSSNGASDELTSNEVETLDDIRNETATPHDHTDDQRAPGSVGAGLDVPNVPDNMPSAQHTVSNNQGGMPSSVDDRMDTQQDWTLFGTLSIISSLAQVFNFFADADQPSNANYSGPLFPQDARPRRSLPFGRVPMYASNIEATAAALVPGEADTRSAWDFPPNIPSTLTSDNRQSQMETPQASNPYRTSARIQRSDTRMEPSQFTNRVNKSIRRRKPATAQRLQSQIANNASSVLEQLASQTVEAQKDSDIDAEFEEE